MKGECHDDDDDDQDEDEEGDSEDGDCDDTMRLQRLSNQYNFRKWNEIPCDCNTCLINTTSENGTNYWNGAAAFSPRVLLV